MRKIVAKMFTLIVLPGLSVIANESPQNPLSRKPSVPANSTAETATVHHDSAVDTKGISTRSLDLDFYMPEIHVHEYADPAIGGNPLSTFAFEDFDDLNDAWSSENNTSPSEVGGLASSSEGTGSPSDQIVRKDGQPHVDNKTVVARENSRNDSGILDKGSISKPDSRPFGQTLHADGSSIGGMSVSGFRYEDIPDTYKFGQFDREPWNERSQNQNSASQTEVTKEQNDGGKIDLAPVVGGKPVSPNKFEDLPESLRNQSATTLSLRRQSPLSERSQNQSSASQIRSNSSQIYPPRWYTIPPIEWKPSGPTFTFEDFPGNYPISTSTARTQNRWSQIGQPLSDSSQSDIKKDQNVDNRRSYHGELQINGIGGKPLLTYKFEDISENLANNGNSNITNLLTNGASSRLTQFSQRSPNQNYQSAGHFSGDRAGAERIEKGTPSFDNDREPASAGKARLPWQVSVFSKQKMPYARVCGGSLVSNAAVVSAAHCFWGKAGLLPASQFAVGAGEVLPYRPYRMDDYGSYRQQNDVAAIKVPEDFGGSAGARSDIAVVLLARPLFNERGLRPVCVSFDTELEERQLVAGTLATTLGVGLLKVEGLSVLERLEVPYIAEEACSRAVDREMLADFTGDKICAGFKPGTSPALGTICSIDPGAGLAFIVGVPYLRGVASSLPLSPSCAAPGVTLFTRVRDHRVFLEEHLGGVAGECARYYPQVPALVDTGGAVIGLVWLPGHASAQNTQMNTTTTAISTSDPVKECLTARNVSGVCVQRNSCDYSTGAIDLTLFAPHGYKRPCELAEVCCPHAAIVHVETPVPAASDSDEDFD